MSTGKNKQLRNSYFVEGLQTEQMKTHVELINPGTDDRVKFLYEANADTSDGQPCLKSAFVYVGSSQTPLYSIEMDATWNGQWDIDAEAIAQGLGYSVKPE
jgi:hypothetical protein